MIHSLFKDLVDLRLDNFKTKHELFKPHDFLKEIEEMSNLGKRFTIDGFVACQDSDIEFVYHLHLNADGPDA